MQNNFGEIFDLFLLFIDEDDQNFYNLNYQNNFFKLNKVQRIIQVRLKHKIAKKVETKLTLLYKYEGEI